MSKYGNSMAWTFDGHEVEVSYHLDLGYPGSGWGDPYGPVQPEPPSLINAEFVPSADLSAEQAAALVARMNGLLELDEAFRLALESDCFDHAQAREESRAEDRLD
jgi:hypothetical protein